MDNKVKERYIVHNIIYNINPTFYYLFIKLGLKGYGRETKNVSDVSHHHKYSVCRRG